MSFVMAVMTKKRKVVEVVVIGIPVDVMDLASLAQATTASI